MKTRAVWKPVPMATLICTGFVLLGVVSAFGPAPSPAEAKVQEGPVAIVSGTHPTHRDAAAKLVEVLKRRNVDCVLVELPVTEGGGETPVSRGDAASTSSAPAQSASVPTSQPAATAEVAPDGDLRDRIEELARRRPRLIVTAGAGATAAVLERIPNVPVIFFVVPNVLDAPFVREDSPDHERVIGVTTDVAPGEQIRWISRVASGCTRFGILYSERTARTAEALKTAGETQGFEVVMIDARKEDFATATDALRIQRCDAVLMLPDARIYNAESVHALLLWGLRYKKPVFTFSENVAKAGALAAQYCSLGDVVEQTADLAASTLSAPKRTSLRVNHPRRVLTAINERTAEMIGIQLSGAVLDAATVRFAP